MSEKETLTIKLNAMEIAQLWLFAIILIAVWTWSLVLMGYDTRKAMLPIVIPVVYLMDKHLFRGELKIPVGREVANAEKLILLFSRDELVRRMMWVTPIALLKVAFILMFGFWLFA